MKIMKYYLLWVVFVLIFTGCNAENKTPKQTYPQYKIIGEDSKTIEIIKYKNKVQLLPAYTPKRPIMFFFIQPSCTECFRGIEHIERLYEEYKDKIYFFAILSDSQSNEEKFKSEVETLKKNYALNFDFYRSVDEDFLQSFDRESDSNFIALYDSSLSLVGEYEGIIPEEMLELDINLSLK